MTNKKLYCDMTKNELIILALEMDKRIAELSSLVKLMQEQADNKKQIQAFFHGG